MMLTWIHSPDLHKFIHAQLSLERFEVLHVCYSIQGPGPPQKPYNLTESSKIGYSKWIEIN